MSYNEKHNEANGEGGNDGESHNRSWNCGVEGETDDPTINALRLRQQRNFITTLMVSQGVPMLAHGDELGRTQRGNNNVYAQDNEIAWVDWDLDADQKDLLAFTSAAIALRKAHRCFRRRRFFAGDAAHGGKSELGDIEWFRPDGAPMDEGDWNSGFARSLMVFLNGDAIPELDHMGRRITDDHFLLLFNAHSEPISFTLPPKAFGSNWRIRLDTATGAVDPAGRASPGAPGPSTRSRRTPWWCCPPPSCRRPSGPPPNSGRSWPWVGPPRSRPRRPEPRADPSATTT